MEVITLFFFKTNTSGANEGLIICEPKHVHVWRLQAGLN